MGNVATHSLDKLMLHPVHSKFAAMKGALPQTCTLCEWKSLCFGGCPRNRKWSPDGVSSNPDYFCTAYRKIYEYADERMKVLGTEVRKQLFNQNVMRYLKGRPPGRNEPCACGSGRKYKYCCSN
ncbi:Anaerobic sulfatase-maturating enzyme [compost metagenome]